MQHIAVEGLGAADVGREHGDLAEAANGEGGGIGHGCGVSWYADAVGGDAGPGTEGVRALHAELAGDVVEVVLDRVEARSALAGDAPPAQTVAQPVEHGPFRGGQDVRVGRPAPASTRGHGGSLAASSPNFPPPPGARGRRAGGDLLASAA